jgi:glycosyltransferase involved in cell wall biosynthesis
LLVQALALLPKDLRTHIVIIGRSTDYKKVIIEDAHREGVSELLIFLHGVSFEDLPAIYQGARVFVYPSIFEGFGIPIVEALESSVPVISTTGSCLSEAGGPGSVYVNPHDPRGLADQIQKILSHEEIRKQMIDLGKQHVKLFEPKVIAEKLMSVYESVLDV